MFFSYKAEATLPPILMNDYRLQRSQKWGRKWIQSTNFQRISLLHRLKEASDGKPTFHLFWKMLKIS